MTKYDQVKKDSKSMGETRDCAVKAVAIVTNTPYKVVHKMMAKLGRKSRQGTYMEITMKVLKQLGCYVERNETITSRTISTLEAQLPEKGRFLVQTRSHVLACVNGEVCDWTQGRRHQPKQIFEISF